ncbi:serine/threonine-protein phosphatase 4 regulatory subunit 2 [Entomortierella parvispora]|uniref:Serine/threonine-protein phosphatase 4 regulatory subunit 2 n=1 Tax=Entomortierella parvispora TaxID=205924 RepID=A0A9P3HAS7_9FUNG|nr:serine/threonine-protein phosphatase 4 regulatory subunit 2 [Entomortierella parvispora]
MTHSPTSTSSTSIAEHDAVIQEIARTNQITLPWEKLRDILQDRLCRVLESGQLVFTASSVTNPLTTTVASPVGSATAFGFLNLPGPSPITSSTTSPTATPSIPPAEGEEKQPVEGEQAAAGRNVPEQDTTTTTTTQAKEPSATQEQKGKGTADAGSDDKGSGETNLKESKETSADQDQQKEESASEQKDSQAPSSPSPSGNVTTEDDNDKQDAAMTGSAVLISKDTLLLETPEGYHDRIRGLLNTFTSAPFTIQRVCELLSNPTEHHSSVIKYLRAVEKVLMITSSINEFSNPAYHGTSALDEDSTDSAAVEKESSVANGDGDYSRVRDLDFSLITSMPNTDANGGVPKAQVSDEDEDVTTAFLAEQEPVTRESQTEEREEEDSEEAEKRDMQMKHQDEKNQGGIGSDMDVDAAGGGSTMEGVETDGGEELQPESSKGDNPMDVDQA